MTEALDKALEGFDLLLASEKSGVNGTEGKLQTLEMVGNKGQISGQMAEIKIRKSARVRGKERGWNGNGLVSHHRQRGDNNRQRTSADAGKIVYRGDARRG